VEELEKLEDDDGDGDEPERVMTASERLDWETFLAEVNHPLTPAEQAEFDRRRQRLDKLRAQDILTIASQECDRLALGLVQALRPVIEARADPVLSAALETIQHFMYMISVKTQRAVASWLDAKEDDERDDDLLSDYNGTAKLLRLIIKETIDAWGMLRQAGLANGAPAKMIEKLERLDGLLQERFPHAMAVVRPGLDEG